MRCIQTLRLKRELPQLYFRKKSVQGDCRPLTGKPSLPSQQIANMGQRRTSCILLEFVPSGRPGLRTGLGEELIDRALAFRRDRIGHAPVKRSIHLCAATFGLLVQCRESRQLEAASDQFLMATLMMSAKSSIRAAASRTAVESTTWPLSSKLCTRRYLRTIFT
jgi:hypothetical protein